MAGLPKADVAQGNGTRAKEKLFGEDLHGNFYKWKWLETRMGTGLPNTSG